MGVAITTRLLVRLSGMIFGGFRSGLGRRCCLRTTRSWWRACFPVSAAYLDETFQG